MIIVVDEQQSIFEPLISLQTILIKLFFLMLSTIKHKTVHLSKKFCSITDVLSSIFLKFHTINMD